MMWQFSERVYDDTFATIKNLSEGDAFFFRVLALNRVGCSAPLDMDIPVIIKSPFGRLFYQFNTILGYLIKQLVFSL